jgi:hypothetical protein
MRHLVEKLEELPPCLSFEVGGLHTGFAALIEQGFVLAHVQTEKTSLANDMVKPPCNAAKKRAARVTQGRHGSTCIYQDKQTRSDRSSKQMPVQPQPVSE